MDLKILQDTPPWEWPRDVGKTFLKVLNDPRASESARLIAADLAGNFVVINDKLAEALLSVAGNAKESEQLRVTAAISFGPVLESADTNGFDDPDDLPPITERTFRKIQESLRKLYLDSSAPKLLRRRILEVLVRAPEPWQQDAIADAYSSKDPEWMLTAVFAMRYVRGFDEQILEALKSAVPEIHFEALLAAGNWGLDAAWPHVVKLVEARDTPKELLLAAIEAVNDIRPAEAAKILLDLAESDDEEIAEAANDAISMAEGGLGEEDDEDDDDEEEEEGEWLN